MTTTGFVENEVSQNAKGGTEITKGLLKNSLDPALLDHFQIVPSRVREIDESKIRVFWANDLPEDPESARFKDANFRNKFHAIVYTSNWLAQRYQTVLGIPYQKNYQAIDTAVDPITNISEDKFTKLPIRLVYTSTPNRGLALLLPCFEKLQEKYKDQIHLDVFSSFKIYGWDEMDKQFEPLYEACRKNPGVTYHGFKPHEEVVKYLGNEGHILAYPCIWPETSCRAVIEAMSAKLICVHSNYAALPDTTGGLNLMYQGDQDHQNHANVFVGALDQAISLILGDGEFAQGCNPMIAARLDFNKAFVDSRFATVRIAMQWQMTLKGLLEQYPTPESRKFASEMFVYKQ